MEAYIYKRVIERGSKDRRGEEESRDARGWPERSGAAWAVRWLFGGRRCTQSPLLSPIVSPNLNPLSHSLPPFQPCSFSSDIETISRPLLRHRCYTRHRRLATCHGFERNILKICFRATRSSCTRRRQGSYRLFSLTSTVFWVMEGGFLLESLLLLLDIVGR
ncbi:hypothetical protein ACLOJK_010192 [Asimina triloba]